MNPQLKRILGLVLILISIVSLIISAAGVIALWNVRPAITLAMQDTVQLAAETLVTTQKALVVADTALQNATDTVQVLSGSIDSVADSIGSTQHALNSVTMLVKQDLPKSIESARASLASAQETARVVDTFLSGLSRIQFLNINYNPDVPLDSSFGQIGASLSGMPSQLTKLGGDLEALNQNLPAVIRTVRGLDATSGDVKATLAEARTVIKEYAAQLTRTQTAIKPIGEGIPTYVTLFMAALTFIMGWISAVQIIVLVIGWRWLRPTQRPA
jgi:hypothetical protein